jgi:hypothetical protein
VTGGGRGGGEWEPNQILLQEPSYVSSSNPKAKTLQEGDEHINQQCRNDIVKVMNASEKEWDQLNTWIAKFGQNSHQTLQLKISSGHVRPWTGYARSRWIYLVKLSDMSGPPRNFLLIFNS